MKILSLANLTRATFLRKKNAFKDLLKPQKHTFKMMTQREGEKYQNLMGNGKEMGKIMCLMGNRRTFQLNGQWEGKGQRSHV
jgi:hypothetical protein